jgi:DNA-binding NarL/FixJ family response regulator
MEKLKTTVLPTDDFQYITDFEAHAIGVKNYNDMILREGLKEERQRITYFYEDIVQRAEQEKQLAEQEKQRAEQEKQVLLTKQLHLVEKCLKRGDSLAEIASFLELDRETLDAYIEQLKLSK